MTIDAINKFAFVGEMPEAVMTCPERCLYYSLRDTYRLFKAGKITKEQGEAAKNKCVRQYKLDSGELDAARKVVKANSEMWKRIEYANMAYNKDRTLENADAFIEAVYNIELKPIQKDGEVA